MFFNLWQRNSEDLTSVPGILSPFFSFFQISNHLTSSFRPKRGLSIKLGDFYKILCGFVLELWGIEYIRASDYLIAMSKSLNCSVKKALEAYFAIFGTKIFVFRRCNTTVKEPKVFSMAIFAFKENKITWDFVKSV